MWHLKICAFLHDPPDKVCDIRGHEERARRLLEAIGADCKDREISEKVRLADRMSAAMDRVLFDVLKGSPKEAYFYDPFRNEDVSINCGGFGRLRKFMEVTSEVFRGDPKAKFFALWRLLPEAFPHIWYIPADTRVPYHSVYYHMSTTSAIAVSLPRPAFLLFSIGPVQGFIRNARKTIDLWGASYLLSYLTWKAMERVARRLGPDSVIFPSLYSQPLADLFVFSEVIGKEKTKLINALLREVSETSIETDPKKMVDSLRVASFPNRFLAIVPASEGADIAKECEEALRKEWRNILMHCLNLDRVKENLLPEVKNLEGDVRALSDFFEVHWAVLPWWPEDKEEGTLQDLLEEFRILCGGGGEETEIYRKLVEKPAYKNLPSTAGYGLLYKLSEKLLASAKSVRVAPMCERLKVYRDMCSVCGELPAVADIYGDRMCPVCIAKRFFAYYLAEKVLGNRKLVDDFYRFPSTSEVASTTAKYALLGNERVLENYGLGKCQNPRGKLPYYRRPVPKLLRNWRQYKLTHVDGRLLYGPLSDAERQEIEKEVEERGHEWKEVEELAGALEKALKSAGTSACPYLAVVLMDGDRMGEWLSGRKNRAFKEVVHKELSEELENKMRDVAGEPYPVTPSFHAQFSHKLLCFARDAQRIVEENLGAVVYAGGDDLLALVPAEKALDVAFGVQEKFRSTFGGSCSESSGEESSGEPRASMSAGIVIFHHSFPLRVALEEARKAEKKAKDAGRNRVCVHVLKRSGDIFGLVAQWGEGDSSLGKTFNRIFGYLEKGYIPHKLFAELDAFISEVSRERSEKAVRDRSKASKEGSNRNADEEEQCRERLEEMLCAELRRLVKRKVVPNLRSKGLSGREIDRIAREIENTGKVCGVETFAKLGLLAEFIQRWGEE